MGYTIEIKELPAQLTLQTHKTVTMETIGQGMGEAFGAVMGQAEAGGHSYAGPPFVIYPEDCSGEFEMLLCMPVAPGGAEPAAASGVTLAEMPACTAACAMHLGPYDKVGAAYEALGSWMREHQRIPSGPPREIYLNDPAAVAPEELLTEIAWPIA
jgi:effector-binding domain-containing protein